MDENLKRNVLLVSPYSHLKVGGICTWTKNVLDYYTNDGQCHLVLFNTAFRFKSNPSRIVFLRILYGFWDSLVVLSGLFFKLLRYKPQAIHYTSSASFALGKDLIAVHMARLFGIRFIIHWHFGRIPQLADRNSVEWKLLKFVAKAADSSIVLDRDSLVCLSKNGVKGVVMVPNPISISLQEKSVLADFTSRSIDRGSFVFVGFVETNKGVFELVEACSQVDRVERLLLIGPVTKEVKDQLNGIASKRDRGEWLIWKGELPREEVIPYLYTANALCLPSYSEGFPNVILEAMAVGCSVIATRVGAIEEMMASDDYGKAGIVIDLKNIGQLKQALNFMIDHPEKSREYGLNGRQRVLSKYTLDKVYPQYLSLWSELK